MPTIHRSKNNISTLPHALRSVNFYGETIVLEFESDFSYLGLRIIPVGRNFDLEIVVPGYEEIESFVLQPPALLTNRWRYRTAVSAGSTKGLLVGFESRLHTAAYFATPTARGREAVTKLLVLALVTGQDMAILGKIVVRHKAKYPLVYAQQFMQVVRGALKMPRESAISRRRQLVGQTRS